VDLDQTLLRSSDNFLDLLSNVSDQDLSLPTPCDDWSVKDLIWHVARASDMSVLLLRGGSKAEASKLFEVKAPDDVLVQCRRALDQQLSAFNAAHDLDQITHHPMGDVSVRQLFDFRIMDLTLHYWDLARAIGSNEEMPGELVAYVFAMLEPLEGIIERVGVFGSGPSRALADDASLQMKLLDLSGRRP
jgi:uncharacterized protein (TIGR03086 family)